MGEVLEVAETEEVEEKARQRARRPYSLLTFIEYLEGPMPGEDDEVAFSSYRRKVQGMYDRISVNAKVAVIGEDGKPVIDTFHARDDEGNKLFNNDGTPKMKERPLIRFESKSVNRRWWIRHAQSGLTAEEADRLACAIGSHPSLVWKSWFEDSRAEMAELTDGDWVKIIKDDARRTAELVARTIAGKANDIAA